MDKSITVKRPFLVALVLFGSTLYFCDNTLLLLLLPILFFGKKSIWSLREKRSVLLIIAFVLCGLLNASYRVVSNNEWIGGLRTIFTLPLVLVTIYLSGIFDDFRVRKLICIFIVAECFLGSAEFALDNPHPFPGQFEGAVADYSNLSGFETLYFNRAYGISNNSSVFAQKIFILVLMLGSGDFGRFSKRVRFGMVCLIFGGLIATFNRTVIFAIAVFGALFLIRQFCHNLKTLLLVSVSLISTLALLVIVYPMALLDGVLDFGVSAGGLDSRYVIWEESLAFINQHPLWGNHSTQIFFDYFGTSLHAHNSFIEMIAMHGVLIASLLFLFVFLNISKINFPVVIAIMAYSLTQYGIFWAISLLDIVFYYYLLRPPAVMNLQKLDYMPSLSASCNKPILGES